METAPNNSLPLKMREPEPNDKSTQQKKTTKRNHTVAFQSENIYIPENEPPKKVRVTKAVKPKTPSPNIINKINDENLPTIVTLPRDVLLVYTRQDLDEFVKKQTGGRKLTKEEKLEVSRQRKLIKNRKSASASRKRKKEHLEILEENHRALAQENLDLKERILALESENKKMNHQVSVFSKLYDQFPFFSSAFDQYKSFTKQHFNFSLGMKQAVLILLIFQIFLSLSIHFSSTPELNAYASKQLQFLDYYNVNNNNNNLNSNFMSNHHITDITLTKHSDISLSSNSKYSDHNRSNNILDHSFLENDKYNLDNSKEFGLPPVSQEKELLPSDFPNDKTNILEYFNDNSDINNEEYTNTNTNRTILMNSTNFLEDLDLPDLDDNTILNEPAIDTQAPELDLFSEILNSNSTFENDSATINGENIFYDSTPYNISFILAGNLDFNLDEVTPNNRCVEF